MDKNRVSGHQFVEKNYGKVKYATPNCFAFGAGATGDGRSDEAGTSSCFVSRPAVRQAQHNNKNKNPRCQTPGETTKN